MEQNYIVSARKYRPSLFREVVGQETVTQTLKNAILTDHLAQSYLFCGPRGVGKTTVARILARTINCENPSPEGEPCNECASCKAFLENRSYNIHELDAASNNSVEDIRTLIDQVRIPPQMGRYSVYIIDEVHMLSSQAFNAFLKTLEEPPSYAVFILATTEKQKIIPTILSRCQVFDFNRISVEDIAGHLEYVAEKEGIQAEPEALNVIARKADGALRDALSIFDQLVSYAGKELTYSSVIKSLNILDYDYYFKLTDAFLEGDSKAALLIFDEILAKGFDAQQFLAGLSSHFRDLLVAHDKETLPLLEVGASVREKYLTQAHRASPVFLFRALDICYQADITIRNSRNQRLHVELALLKISDLKKKDDPPLSETGKEEAPAVKKKAKEETKPSAEKKAVPPEPEKDRPAAVAGKAGAEEAPVNEPKASETPVQEKKGSSPAKAPPSYKNTEPEEVVTDTISIRDVLNGDISGPPSSVEEPETPRETATTGREKAFNEAMLKKKWSDYADSLAKDKPRLAAALRHHLPDITGTNIIRITVENKNLKEDFENHLKPALMEYLRNELENDRIALRIDVEETPGGSKKPYTPEEKYEYMKKKNPEIEKMRRLFDLDLE